METFVATAIVGTGQQSPSQLTTGTAVDELASQLTAKTVERSVLLTAGAWNVYRRAGYSPAKSATSALPTAAEETQELCSPRAAQLLTGLLEGKHREILPEALERLQQHKLRLPYELLVAALTCGAQAKNLRPGLVVALGERGRWLSQFNPSWSWVQQFLPHTEALHHEQAQTIWQEGSLGQRVEVLRQLRSSDPDQAREWLSKVWKQEKAEARLEFLKTFEMGLSAEDEPFLERALDDRSENVRTLAASLLIRIPTSGLRGRMIARADTMLVYKEGTLEINPPERRDIDKQWQRDGVVLNAPHLFGERAWWLFQVVSVVPPTHWQERCAISAQDLIKIAEKQYKKKEAWYDTLFDAWSSAAVLHNAQNWLTPLWGHLATNSHNEKRFELLKRMSQQEAESNLAQLLDSAANHALAHDLSALPQPWSQEFGERYVQRMRAYIQSLTKDSRYDYNLEQSLAIAAVALPAACFQVALAPWDFPEETSKNWHAQHARQTVALFTELIHIRKRLLEEIA